MLQLLAYQSCMKPCNLLTMNYNQCDAVDRWDWAFARADLYACTKVIGVFCAERLQALFAQLHSGRRAKSHNPHVSPGAPQVSLVSPNTHSHGPVSLIQTPEPLDF